MRSRQAAVQVVELRVDVDGSHANTTLSGDVYFRFRIWGFDFTIYLESFVVETPVIGGTTSEMTIGGAVSIYGQPGQVNDRSRFTSRGCGSSPTLRPPASTGRSAGRRPPSTRPKISEYFRTATVEVDRFRAVFPPEMNPSISPSPSGLPSSVGIGEVFQRSSLGPDRGARRRVERPDRSPMWARTGPRSSARPHGDTFRHLRRHVAVADVQRDRPAVRVTRTTARATTARCSTGVAGRRGDTFLRQGCAIAEEAIRGRRRGRHLRHLAEEGPADPADADPRDRSHGTCLTRGSAPRRRTARRPRS